MDVFNNTKITPRWRRKRFGFRPTQADVAAMARAEAKRQKRRERNQRRASK